VDTSDAVAQAIPSGSVKGKALADVEPLARTTSATPSTSTLSSIRRVAGPVSFFAEVATFQIVPSGACTTPP
jgi:hypothetical protein